jgi:hypothetical protein
MKPNGPAPVLQPMVVARALPSATRVKIVPWTRSSHRRNVGTREVGLEVVKGFAISLQINGFND